VLAAASDPKSFNPIIAKETSTTAITGYLFEGLTRTNGVTLEVEPALAERWEHDASGKVWTFHLRRDVVWHDGAPFTADDVLFTFRELIYNRDIPTSSRDIFLINGRPVELRKIDDYTVIFNLPDSFAPFLRLLNQDILPAHVLRDKVRRGVFTSSWGVNERPENIVGTGPFRLKSYRPAEWVMLDRNERYWKRGPENQPLPYLDRIVHMVIADPNMGVLKFKAGEIDAVSVRGQDYALLKPYEKKGNYTIYEIGPSMGEEFLVFNQNKAAPLPKSSAAWFAHPAFRQAVAHAIDKGSIIKNVLGGFGVPQDGPLNVSSGFFYNPQAPRYAYDPQKARALLAGAGFSSLEFTILTNSNNPERIQTASIIQDDLRKLGMRVNLLPVEFNTLVTKLSVTKDWEAVLIGLTGGIEPHGGKNVWMSSGQLHIWNLGPGNAPQAWEKDVDRIFEAGATELDPAARKKLYDRWQTIVCAQLPVIYTVNSLVMYGVRNKFGNLKPSVYGGIFHNIEELYVKR